MGRLKQDSQDALNGTEGVTNMHTSTISRAWTIKLWSSAFEAKSPRGRLLHCLLISSSIAVTSTPSPATTRTTWLSGPCSAWNWEHSYWSGMKRIAKEIHIDKWQPQRLIEKKIWHFLILLPSPACCQPPYASINLLKFTFVETPHSGPSITW